MADRPASASGTARRRTRWRLAAAAGAVAAATGVWLVARYGAGIQLRTPGFTSAHNAQALSAGFVIVVSAVASAAAWGAVTVLERIARRPRRAWIAVGILATVASLTAPLSGHGVTGTERLALVCMHLAVAAVLVPVLALTIRPGRSASTSGSPAGSAVAGRPHARIRAGQDAGRPGPAPAHDDDQGRRDGIR